MVGIGLDVGMMGGVLGVGVGLLVGVGIGVGVGVDVGVGVGLAMAVSQSMTYHHQLLGICDSHQTKNPLAVHPQLLQETWVFWLVKLG